jgi:hypothetical protein
MSIFAKPDQNFTFHDGSIIGPRGVLRQENTMLRRQAAALARHNEYLKELVLQSVDVVHVN